MNNRYRPLDVREHGEQGWAETDQYSYLARIAYLPVVLAEATQVIHLCPLAFLPEPGESRRFQCVAVLAPHAGDNLYVDDQDRWVGGYVPAMARAQPFVLIPKADSAEAGQFLIGLDTQSPNLRSSPNPDRAEHRFFDAAGALSPAMQKRAAFLAQLHQSQQATARAIAELAAQNLLVPWTPQLPELPEQPVLAKGLYHIDAERLPSLSADQLQQLNQTGALTLLYAQLFSESRISLLLQLYQLRTRQRAGQPNTVAATDQEGELKFAGTATAGTLNLSFLNSP